MNKKFIMLGAAALIIGGGAGVVTALSKKGIISLSGSYAGYGYNGAYVQLSARQNGSNASFVTGTLTADYGRSVDLKWKGAKLKSCTGNWVPGTDKGGGKVSSPNGSAVVGPITTNQYYQITCEVKGSAY